MNRKVLLTLSIAILMIGSSLVGDQKVQKGKFLVAARSLGDPRFQESVVLVIQQDDDGAAGLIINHPTKVLLSQAFDKITGMKKKDGFLHIGGPVDLKQYFILIRSRKQPAESVRVFGDIFVSQSNDTFTSLVQDGGNRDLFRVYAGYAGWGKGQLEAEIAGGFWHVMDADAKAVMEKPSEKIWPEFIQLTEMLQARLR